MSKKTQSIFAPITSKLSGHKTPAADSIRTVLGEYAQTFASDEPTDDLRALVNELDHQVGAAVSEFNKRGGNSKKSLRAASKASDTSKLDRFQVFDVDLTCAIVAFLQGVETLEGSDFSRAEFWLTESVTWLRDLFAEGAGQSGKDADRLRVLISDRITLHMADSFPWVRVQPASTGLALLFQFAPFQDTGSTVAGKRIRNFGKSVDVIATSFLHKRKLDPTIERISAPYVTSKFFLTQLTSWDVWDTVSGYAQRASDLAERYIEHSGGRYEFFYTRAMWAPPLVAGAVLKLRHPELRWVAEFSDPLSLDVEGNRRGRPIVKDAFLLPLIAAYEKAFGRLSETELGFFAFTERLVYAFADEIVFTNENQRTTMLEQVTNQALRDRINRHSVVSNHPTLPVEFYDMMPSEVELDRTKLNLAYFGEFYSSRGLTEVSAAIRELPEELRSIVRLHVFTNYVPSKSGGRRAADFNEREYNALVDRAVKGVGAEGIEELVEFHPSLPYLSFLSTTNDFDYLLVNDTSSGKKHPVNPYLPSKWSDYKGSRASTWALVEEGSVLSTMDPEVKTSIGSVPQARSFLEGAAREKLSGRAKSGGRSGVSKTRSEAK